MFEANHVRVGEDHCVSFSYQGKSMGQVNITSFWRSIFAQVMAPPSSEPKLRLVK